MAESPLFEKNLLFFTTAYPTVAEIVRARETELTQPVFDDDGRTIDIDFGHGRLYNRPAAEFAAEHGVACSIGSNLEYDIATAAMCHLIVATENIRIEEYPGDVATKYYMKKSVKYVIDGVGENWSGVEEMVSK